MKKSKSKTIEAKETPKSRKGIEESPQRYIGKFSPSHNFSSKVGPKNSSKKHHQDILSSPKGIRHIKHQMSNVDIRVPEARTLKAAQSHVYLRSAAKEIERPKIVKKKNENLSSLQSKLRTLESQITNLKCNISSTDQHLQRIRKSRTKSKESKKSSVSVSASKKRAAESVDKQSIKKVPSESKASGYKSMVRSPSKGLNSFVTKWKPTEANDENSPANHQSEVIKSKSSHTYYTKHVSATMKQHLLQSIKLFAYLQNVEKPADCEIEDLKVKLPSNKNFKRKTLVFDLDETLIHCVEANEDSDIKLPIVFPNGDVVQAGINIRKYARQMLTNLSKKFEIIVFTASHSCYADVILDYLDPQKCLISHRFYRQSCYKTQQGMFIKDLRIFRDRNLDNLVLIDNAPYSYYFQLSNGIPILPFYNSKTDTQLKSLEKFLLSEIYPAGRVQPVLQKHFKLSKYKEYSSAEKIIQQLYKD